MTEYQHWMPSVLSYLSFHPFFSLSLVFPPCVWFLSYPGLIITLSDPCRHPPACPFMTAPFSPVADNVFRVLDAYLVTIVEVIFPLHASSFRSTAFVLDSEYYRATFTLCSIKRSAFEAVFLPSIPGMKPRSDLSGTPCTLATFNAVTSCLPLGLDVTLRSLAVTLALLDSHIRPRYFVFSPCGWLVYPPLVGPPGFSSHLHMNFLDYPVPRQGFFCAFRQSHARHVFQEFFPSSPVLLISVFPPRSPRRRSALVLIPPDPALALSHV